MARVYRASARAASSLSAPPSVAAPHAYLRLRYVFDCSTVAELAALRAPLRAAHLAHVATAAPALAGAVSCEPPESLLLWRAADKDAAQVEAFARADPYVAGGIVARWDVAPFTVVAGSG